MDAEGYRVRKARARMLRSHAHCSHSAWTLKRIWVAPAKCSLKPGKAYLHHVHLLLITKMKLPRGSSVRARRFTVVVSTRGAVIETEEKYSYSRSDGQVYPMEKSGFKI